MNGLEKKYSGRFKIVWVDVDTAPGKNLARQYGVIGQPTIIMLDAAGQEIRRLQGEQSAARLEQIIDSILEQQ